ncbi:Cyclin-D-binding Myb-like transcription factor 1 [Cucurbita argyrosperma subsp. argyrosperma]|nr:Cyclin-D-binding Myb-like transcription factor 1 [Cucurbita argyrosperma subsp. argyrosperma]
MTTPELFAQDEDVTHDKMQMQRSEKTKWPDVPDTKNDVEKKKKKRKKEHKTHKNEQKEETESETEPWAKNEEIETETETCVKKDKEMEKQKKKKAKLLSPKGSSNYERGPDGGKEKMKKKKKQKTEDSKESSSHIKEEKKRKKTKYVEGGSQEKVHGGGTGLTENEDIGGPSERLSPDEGSSNRKRGPDGGKEKKKKKQKTEDSRDNSLHIKNEKKLRMLKVREGGAGLTENEDVVGPSERPSPKGSSKKVRFSEDVEIFPIADGKSRKKTKQEDDGKSRKNTKQEDDGLIRGKRFSKEEDEIVKTAVMQYIHEHGLGDEGLKKVLKCREFPELKNCWKDIGKSLPYRPYLSVYYRAHILFERDESRKWTPEEYEIVRKFHEKYGSDWKGLADALGKHRFHVKDTWRRIKLTNMKKGRWTQDEYQKLFDLVNTDLRNKASEEKISKHGMLRDNICWGAISDKLATRSNALCCMKWYRQLTSPMVAEGDWEDVDDYRLVDALSNLDAVSIEDVEWDQLLEHRDGDICRKRWSQMVKHIGDNGNKSFSEQVELLSKRYSIDVLEAREAFDDAPIVLNSRYSEKLCFSACNRVRASV